MLVPRDAAHDNDTASRVRDLLPRASRAASSTPVDPATPERLAQHKDVQPLLAGFVDPTLPPYRAADDGVVDDAAALQAAIDDAYVARMTVVLPAGREFLLSTQLRFVQPPNVTGRSYGFAMVGGRTRAGKQRPVLRLQDGASTAGWVGMPHNGTEPMVTGESEGRGEMG